MAHGDTLYRGPSGARDALLVGNKDAALAAVGPNSRLGAMLLDGRTADALTVIEREIDPKWSSVASCQRAYRKAMGGQASAFMEGSR